MWCTPNLCGSVRQDVIEINETLNMTDLLRSSGLASTFTASSDAIYRLSGYLNHRGKSTHVGHYTASVAYPKPDDASSVDWFEFDDSAVNNMTSIVDTEGSKERNGKTLRSRDAYMLLYVREDAGPASTTAAAVQSSSAASSSILPSKECLDEIETLNVAFETDMSEYAEKADALEARIQSRLDAYTRFFEKEQPHPKPEADDFFWVDTTWLHSWIVGEEIHPQQLPATENDHNEDHVSNGVANGGDGEREKQIEGSSDDKSADRKGGDVGKSSGPSLTVLTGGDAKIPFSKPIDVNRFCCIHSIDANTPKPRSSKKFLCKPVSFSPENLHKLKRVSANLFAHLKETCGVATNALLSPTTESRSRRRISSDHSDMGAVFEAASFRCAECETEFCNKLLDDAELLREIELELQLLKTPVLPDDPNPHLMSRAWIASYKAHLQRVQKKILQKPKKKKFKKAGGGAIQEKNIQEHFATTSEGGDASDSLWQSDLNGDITCAHGKLMLKKKKYRAVPASTWGYFSKKFPSHFAFEERFTEPCPQCQVDEAASEEFIQVERACRDEVLSRAPLGRLYRRKPDGSPRTSFTLRGAFSPPGPLIISAERRKMFLISRSWMQQWREYIRNVEQESPPSLTCTDLTCSHGKLLLPQTILSAIKGSPVDASSVEVEFVSEDEMVHLAELYGVPECWYFYGLMQANEQVVWRRCSLSSLVGGAQSIDASQAAEELEGCSVNDDATNVNCLECEQLSEIQHLDELQNFQNRVVNVHLLASDQAVPTEEKLSVETSGSGRQRRSKRIRGGASGTSWSIVANSSDSIYVLKTKIFEETDAYPIRQRLYFKGNALEDRLTLKDCG